MRGLTSPLLEKLVAQRGKVPVLSLPAEADTLLYMNKGIYMVRELQRILGLREEGETDYRDGQDRPGYRPSPLRKMGPLRILIFKILI